MADQAYCGERLLAALDGARLVRYDTAGVLYAWFGGHGVNVYDAAGGEVDYWSLDYSSTPTVEEVEASMARRLRNVDDVIERAEQEGYDAGKAAGSWLLDGNSTEDAARRLLRGIENGDPEVMDALPSAPLSGEYAGDPTPQSVLAGYGIDETHDGADDVLHAYEDGYSRGVQDEAVRSARALVGES